MIKKLFKASVTVPALPRVRFMRNAPPGSAKAFIDVTLNVARIEIETLGDGTDACALIRLDEKGELVWRTIHPSLDETRWQAKHEYDLADDAWSASE